MSNQVVPPAPSPAPRGHPLRPANQVKDLGRNLATGEFPRIFVPGLDDDGVVALYDAVLEKAHQAVHWYSKEIRYKRTSARWVRLLTVVLGGIAAIIPIVSPLIPKEKTGLDIIPLATLSAALAGSLVAFDRYFGYSSGYVRFTNARLEIQGKIEKFQMAWIRNAMQQAATNPPTPKPEVLAAGLNLIQELVEGVSQTVQAETQAWMAEFKQGVADLEKSVSDVKAGLPAASTPGALRVSVDGWDQVADAKITINQREKASLTSPVYVLGNLAPGQYTIHVEATRGGKPVSGAEIVMLKAGEVGEAQVKLG